MSGTYSHTPLMTLKRTHVALPQDRVSIGWLHNALDEQAAYLLMLIFALAGALPAASLPAGLAIMAFSIPLLLSRKSTWLPESIARREIGSRAVRFAMTRAMAALRLCERIAPMSRTESLNRLRPFAGALLFMLGAALLIPIPLSNVLPALSAAAIVLALIEGSVPLFVAGTVGGIASIVLIGEAVLVGMHAISIA